MLKNQPLNLLAAFQSVVAEHPDQVAVVQGSRSYTYLELDQMSSTLAFRLLKEIGPAKLKGASVAVVAQPSIEFVIGALATLKVGGAYLPIDSNLPDEYIRGLIEDSCAVGLLSFESLRQRLNDVQSGFVAFDGAEPKSLPSLASEAPIELKIEGDQPAYRIYTSGSTGRAKAVEISHAAILNSTYARISKYGPAQKLPLIHSVSFDVATGCMFWSILSGGCLVVYEGERSDISMALEFMLKNQVRELVFSASLYGALLDRLEAEPEQAEGLKALRLVILGGERWPEKWAERHQRLLSGTDLFNEYGPTEACVWSSSGQVYSATPQSLFKMSIGQPIENTSYRVVDSLLREVPFGESGELWISGKNLANGYVRRDELNQSCFVTTEDGQRWYRTGDLVKQNEVSDFEFLGRIDRQLKIHGHRIEAGEVEKAILSFAGIQNAYVMGDPGTNTGLFLTAFVVSSSIPIDSLRTFLASRLPGYMVPDRFVLVDKFPQTTNGKIDEHALARLAELSFDEKSLGQDEVEERYQSQDEERLAEFIVSLLNRKKVSRSIKINQLGANSLIFVKIAAYIKREHALEIPMSFLFQDSTVAGISAEIQRRKGQLAPAKAELPPIDPINRKTVRQIGLSQQQKQIWFLHKLSPEARAYNAQFTLRLEGQLDLHALEKSLTHIVERHELLRTTFHEKDGEAVQAIHPPFQVKVDVVDLSNLGEEEKQTQLKALMLDEMRRPFSIDRLPLVRWTLYRLSNVESVLLQIEQHFVHDGWSGALFLKEMRDAYEAYRDGRQPSLSVLPVQYADYTIWQDQWLNSGQHLGQLNYWLDSLKDCRQGVTLPGDMPRPRMQTFEGTAIRFVIHPNKIERLKRKLQEENATIFSAFLSAFAMMVWRYTGEADMVIGSAFSNRRKPEIANLIGMFVNPLPLRVAIDTSQSVGSFVKKTLNVIFGAQDHQEMPLVELIKNLNVDRDQGRSPLFQLMFAFHDSPMPSFQVANLVGEFQIQHNGSAKNDMNVVCVPLRPEKGSPLEHGGIEVIWEFNTSIYKKETVQRWASNFEHILMGLVDRWNEPIENTQLICDGEVEKIKSLALGEPAELPFATLHQGFELALKRSPGALALVSGPTSYTFSELDRLSLSVLSQIQNALITVGGQTVPIDIKDVTIALALPKSPELVAALIAISRLGGRFLNLDYSQPEKRLLSIIETSQPAIVIVNDTTSERFRSVEIAKLNLAQVRNTPAQQSLSLPYVNAEDSAYLVFTSGSTGTPKAVCVSHRNAVTALHARTCFFGEDTPKTLVTLPLHFDVAGSMIFWTLSRGGSVVLANDDEARDPEALLRLIDVHRVTHLNFVSSFYNQALASLQKPWPESVKVVAIGGEACTSELVSLHARWNSSSGLYNEYGPTEATVWSSATCVFSPQKGIAPRVTIGKPLANYAMFILDEKQRLLPIGVRGELCIGGSGVSTGYLNSRELNVTKFKESSLGRIYRTGDEARMLESGEFEIFGRTDDQVKVRGFRIELGEIIAHLAGHKDVASAYVLVDKSHSGGRLVAYIETKDSSVEWPLIQSRLREYILDLLPEYMCPSLFLRVEKMPLTATGKVDRERLPIAQSQVEPEEPTVDHNHSLVATKLLESWKRLLNKNKLSVDDDFFAVGGDSLLSIRAAAAARKEGLNISVSDLMRDRTIRRLAARFEPRQSDQQLSNRPEVVSKVNLTPIQAWFFEQNFADPDFFNQSRWIDLREGISAESVRLAVDELLSRHDAFRTKFSHSAGTWFAELSAKRTGEFLGLVNFSEVGDEEESTSRVVRYLKELKASLDINQDRLYKIAILESNGSFSLFFTLHHLLVDAVSWSVLFDDLDLLIQYHQNGQSGRHSGILAPSLFDAKLNGATSYTPPTPAAVRYWSDLVDKKKPIFAHKGAENINLFGNVQRDELRLSVETTRFLVDDVPRLYSDFGLSTQHFLLAALLESLCERFGHEGLYCMLEGHGRDGLVSELTEVVGWMTKLQPIYLSTCNSRSLSETALQVSHQMASVPNSGSDFARARYLERSSELGSILSRLELPKVAFNYLGDRTMSSGYQSFCLRQMPTGPDISGRNQMPTLLDLTCLVDDSQMLVKWAYGAELFNSEDMQRFLETFAQKLETCSRVTPLNYLSVEGGIKTLPKLFAVHPVGGGIDWYSPMARVFRDDFETYALSSDEESLSRSSIEDMADLYIHRIKRVQPQGPYHLLGWSFGAAVTFEMVRQLERRGEIVRLGVLIDPPKLLTGSIDEMSLVRHLSALLPQLSETHLHKVLKANQDLDAQQVAEKLVGMTSNLTAIEHQFVLERSRKLIRNFNLLKTYSPQGQVDSLYIVYAQDSVTKGLSETERWRDHVKHNLFSTMVPGNHESVMREEGCRSIKAFWNQNASEQNWYQHEV